MEYFDFEAASHDSYAQDDDVASDRIELDENEAIANYDSLRQDQSLEFPNDPLEQDAAEQPAPDPVDTAQDCGTFPMFPAREPCDFCRRMGLDCFVATRGVMQKNGCTCCISLYRECSFTHAKPPGKFLDTLHTVSEDVCISTGGLTGKKALKSLSGVTTSEDVEARAKKNNARLSREAVRILKTWLHEHREHPYPNEQEKDELNQRTGLKRTQISNWLANARRRGKARSASGTDSLTQQDAIDISGQNPELTYMTPMERWKHSPPENEPAATSDILRALMNTPFDPSKPRPSQPAGYSRSLSRKTGSSNDDSSRANSNRHHTTPSISSLETSRSSKSDFSFASAFSHRSSLGSFGSVERKDRRRRRRPSALVNPLAPQKSRSARIFQCTFCADSFPTKYDWQRHEKSLHLALDKWTCSPEGGAVFMDGICRCVFCMAPDPDNNHLESHDYSLCQEKSPHERTFYRKDHLNQHLRLIHHVKFHPSMDKWRSSTTEIKSRCGFCETTFVTWKERVDHLSAHFKSGAHMTQWQGDWGFEPFVQSLVENAIPPYLIGQHKTMNPYRPSHALAPADVPFNEPTSPCVGNCFNNVHRELMTYIHKQLAAGVYPTDRMLQDEARRYIYGNGDQWNQTCADNPVWLSALKRDAGLETIASSDHIQSGNPGIQSPFPVQGGLQQPLIENNPFARAVYNQDLYSPGLSSPSGFQSPGLRTGRSSAAASGPGSSSGSYGGSTGANPAAPHLVLSTDWGCSHSGGVSSFSTPVSGSVDPFMQMGFNPEFLQQLHTGYDELQDGLQSLTFEGYEGMAPPGGMPGSSTASFPVSTAVSAPISIPSPKHSGVPVPDPNTGFPYFPGDTDMNN